jgi:hypothetical protein
VDYLVLIGDVVASRTAGNRRELQRALSAAVQRINASARRRLASPYTITLGDEFQAVYRSARDLFGDLWALLEALNPVELRLAAGIGEIATPINRKQALGMDGAAFHKARAAMDRLKREGRTIIQVQGSEGELALVNDSLRLACRLLSGWKRETLSTLVCLGRGLSVDVIARSMQVTPRAIFKRIRSSSLREVLALAGSLEAELEVAMGRADES